MGFEHKSNKEKSDANKILRFYEWLAKSRWSHLALPIGALVILIPCLCFSLVWEMDDIAASSGEAVSRQVLSLLVSTTNFGSNDGSISLDMKAKVPVLSIKLGKGAQSPKSVPLHISKHSFISGVTYPDGKWCVSAGYRLFSGYKVSNIVIYTNSGFQSKISSCPSNL